MIENRVVAAIDVAVQEIFAESDGDAALLEIVGGLLDATVIAMLMVGTTAQTANFKEVAREVTDGFCRDLSERVDTEIRAGSLARVRKDFISSVATVTTNDMIKKLQGNNRG